MAEMSRHRITFKLALAAALVALLLGFALGAVKASLDFARETDSLKVVVMRTLAVAKPTAARAVVVIDTNLAREVIDGLLEYDFVNSAKIIDDLGEVMAVVSKTQAGAEKHWLAWLVGSVPRTYSIPLLDDPTAYTQQGSLGITIDPVKAFSPFLDRVIHEISLTLVGAFAFAFALMAAFQVLVTRPMVTLAEAFDRISPREPGKSLLPTAIAQQEDELGMVARSGNQLLTAIQDLLHQRNLAEERIRTIAEAVSSVSGDNVLDSLLESLVEILGIDIAFVGVFADDRASWVRTLTVFADGAKADNFEYALAGTPCQGVVGRTACIFNGNVQHEFPDDKLLIEMGMETYVGAPLFDSEDVLVGIIVALNRKPLENPETVSDLLHFFGVRAAAELERCHAETMLRESEERLRAVLDNSPAHIFMKDRDGHYILVNRQFEERYIAAGVEIMGNTEHDLYPKEVADVIRRNDLEVLEKNASIEFEEVIPHPDGDQTFISVKFPLRDASGEPYAVCCVATDITARKKAENALATQTSHLEIAEQMAHVGHWRIDVATRDIFFSDEMYRLHGFVVGSDITWSMLSEASHPDDWKLIEEADRKAIEEKKGSELDRRVIWPNGETRVLHSMSRVELGDDGEVAAIVGVSQDITERKQAEEELARAEIRYRSIVENSTDGIFRSNEEGRLLWANTALARMGGFETAEELLSAVKDITTDIFVNPDDRKNLIEQLKKRGAVKNFVAQGSRPKTGEKFLFDASVRAERDADGMLYMDGVIRDITDAREHEDRLRRVEKMQAIGQLSGGIAHDFNNLLGIIIANLDMLEEDIGDDRRLARPVKTALKAALRSADLTKRLSAFSRQSESKAKPVNLNEVIEGLDDLLARSLTAEIEIRTVLDDALWLTEISEGDFEDVVLNLALNGRDAMPEGGCLVIETTNTELEPTDDEAVDYGGQYVMFAISDNGCGMTEESREKIFDPFFTTKGVGEGSGLGLSMVYGFVARSQGRIQVESEPDQGTTIRIYLPHAQGSKKKSGTKQSRDKSLPRGSETVLIVDDEPDLLAATRESLQTLGYRVMVAEDAKDALRLLENNEDIDMLFTDVVMPGGMNGLELASDAMKQKPDLKVLVTTGFSEKIQRQEGYSRLLDSHLPKPYRRTDLARRIREVLDSGPTISSASK